MPFCNVCVLDLRTLKRRSELGGEALNLIKWVEFHSLGIDLASVMFLGRCSVDA